jgi:hypothetical protein
MGVQYGEEAYWNQSRHEESNMGIQSQEKVDEINRIWGIHDNRSKAENAITTRCMALVVDSRYVAGSDFEYRLAVSFGGNPFSPEMATGFLPPPVKPGKLLFGLHNVGVCRKKITVLDEWIESFAAEECEAAEYVFRTAQAILDGISDEQYIKQCLPSDDGQQGVERSEVWLLDDLVVAPLEQF